ncbi:MAG: autotransporter outer membrane beta-barrel domain-containing protein [Selenomonadaceae bacterium]
MQKGYLLKTNIILALLFMTNHPLVSATELTDINGGHNTVNTGDTVTVLPGQSAGNASVMTNDGTIIIGKNGSLHNNNMITNNKDVYSYFGYIYNNTNKIIINNATGTIDNPNGTIVNAGVIQNLGGKINVSGTGGIENYGTIINDVTGVILNHCATIDNYNSITNRGTITNESTGSFIGTINDYGTINNTGTITGTGSIYINDKGTLINSGTITATGIVVNNGGTFENDAGGTMDTLALNPGGKLNYTGGTVTNLTSSGGTIDLYNNNSSSFRNLTLTSFSGTATAIVHTDIANNTGDHVSISSVTSPSTLNVSVGYDPALTNISAATTIANSGYNLVSASSGTLSVAGKTSEYGAYAVTPQISSSGTYTGFSVGASTNTVGAAASGLRQGQMVQVSMNHLRKRLGELRNDGSGENGAWVRTYGGEINTNKCGRNDSNYSGLQAGYDKKQNSSSGAKFTGGAISYTTSKDSFETGSGNSYDTDFALYQSWVRKDGHYTDLILKHGWLESKYSMTDLSGTYSSADYNTQTDSISAEYGYRKQLNAAWYIEPQTEMTYAHIGGASYATSSGMNVVQDGIDRLIWRNGIGLGRTLNNGNHIYASLSALHEFKGEEQIRANSFKYNETMDGTWGEFILGVDAKLSGHSSGYMNVEKLFGGDVGSNWQYNMGCRFTF